MWRLNDITLEIQYYFCSFCLLLCCCGDENDEIHFDSIIDKPNFETSIKCQTNDTICKKPNCGKPTCDKVTTMKTNNNEQVKPELHKKPRSDKSRSSFFTTVEKILESDQIRSKENGNNNPEKPLAPESSTENLQIFKKLVLKHLENNQAKLKTHQAQRSGNLRILA